MNTVKLQNKTTLFILSLAIAVFIWLVLSLYQSHTATITIPISYKGSTVLKTNPDFPYAVSVKVRGSGFDLIRGRIIGQKAEYDVSQSESEISRFKISEIRLNLPGSLEIISIDPASVIDKSSKQTYTAVEMPIELSFSGKRAGDEFTRLGFRSKVTLVQVSGNKDILENIRSIKTDIIDLNTILKNKDFYIRLISPSSDLSLSRDSILVLARNVSTTSKVFTNVPITAGNGIDFYPSSVTVRLSSTTDRLKGINPKDIQVLMDRVNEKNGAIPLKVILPPDYELLDYTPRFVTLKR